MIETQSILTLSSAKDLSSIHKYRVVVLDGDRGPLNPKQEQALCTFVERGGGLILLGDAVEAYREYDQLGEVLGRVHGICTPHSEIIAHVATPHHYITRRVDSSFAVTEVVYLLRVVPSDAQVLWQTSWHYVPHTLAYTRQYGRGRVFCTQISRGHPQRR